MELVKRFAVGGRQTGEHSYVLYSESNNGSPTSGTNIEWRPINSREPLWHLRVARDANNTCDVFLSTNSYLTPLFLKIPSVVMICDLIPFLGFAKPRLRSRVIERLTLKRAVGRASALIAISQSTATDLRRLFPAAAGKTRIVRLAANDRFSDRKAADERGRLQEKYGLDREYVLVTGTLEPRKNLERLVKAYTALPEDFREKFDLAVVGNLGWATGPIVESLESMPQQRIKRLGFIADDELPALYRNCALFCYPSLYEGFGLPVLEAMQCGAPVLTSDLSSLPEVGGDACVYVDPTDIDAIRIGIHDVLKDAGARERMSRRGVERADAFSWQKTAEEVVAACVSAARSV